MLLLNQQLAGALAAQLSGNFQLRGGPGGQGAMDTALIQGTLTYVAGGTTADAWVQTSLDGGLTWCDVANFHFTTLSARLIYNLSSGTIHTTQLTPTDGTLAANTANDGLLGPLWRVKWTSVGTYTGATFLRVDVNIPGLVPVP